MSNYTPPFNPVPAMSDMRGGWVAGSIGWIVLGFFCIGGLCFALGVLFGPAIGYLTPIGALLILVSLSLLSQLVRRDRDFAALAYLEQAVRLNLPLPAMLRAAEISETPAVRRRLAWMREMLEDGLPIGVSLESAAPSLPRRLVAVIDAAERSGRLSTALTRAVRENRNRPRRNIVGQIYIRWYPLILFVFAGGMTMLLMLIVMPKYQALMADFHLRPPLVTRAISQLTAWVAPAASIVAAIVLIVFCGQMLARLFTARGTPIELFRWPGEIVLWYLPVARTAVRSRALGEVCQVLADATSAGRTLELAIFEASEVPSNVVLQSHLRQWGRELVGGIPIDQAARRARIPSLIAGLLATAPAAGDLPEVFEFLVRYYDGRFSRAAQLLRGAVIPMLALVFGAVVAALALAIFQPLIELTNAIIPHSGVL